jgi:DNA-binding XRE family transcriptional regulator
MRTEHFKPITIHHMVADIKIEPHISVSANTIKQLICLALDSYADDDVVPAAKVHQAAKERHGKNYQTPGYYLKLYRLRKDLTQAQLADLVGIRQHHLSEMENNKRPLGKNLAKQLAEILDIDYRKLL